MQMKKMLCKIERLNRVRTKLAQKVKNFRLVIYTPEGVKPNKHKWVFVLKQNKKDETMRYKAQLYSQGL